MSSSYMFLAAMKGLSFLKTSTSYDAAPVGRDHIAEIEVCVSEIIINVGVIGAAEK